MFRNNNGVLIVGRRLKTIFDLLGFTLQLIGVELVRLAADVPDTAFACACVCAAEGRHTTSRKECA